MSCQPRLNRLFAPDGRCFDVAIDHGMFNEPSFLGGIESIEAALQTVVQAAPDAVQLAPGSARIYQAMRQPHKPALVLRTDIANVYGASVPSHLFSKLIDQAVDQAVRLDAACVVVNLLLLPNQPELHGQCVANVAALKPICEQAGMPLMVEPLVMRPSEKAGGYAVDGDLTKILPLVRQAAELGADVIKADPCDPVEEFHQVVRIAGCVPVLARGGSRAPDQEILARTENLIRQGASGIVYGRNVIQHPNPSGMVRALMGIVHEGETAEKAARRLES